jgi:predicted CoA-binding protein
MNVLVIGASTKPERYSNIAINMLKEFDHSIYALGLRNGVVNEIEISTSTETVVPENVEIDTVTLYLNEARQEAYYDYIIGLKPRRVIFNPGTENTEFYGLLEKANIEYEVACTLVLLRTKLF